jgi:hypothetical protein
VEVPVRRRSDNRFTPSGRLRRVVAAAAASLLGLLAGCSLGGSPGTSAGAPLAADVTILDEPVGGRGAVELSCTFEVSQIGTELGDPITIQVDWSASCGTHKTETFTFRGGSQAFTSTYEDPTGYPIAMTFWATIRWEDSRGPHTLRSASASSASAGPAG